MLSFLPNPIIVILAVTYVIFNFAIFLPIVFILALIKLCVPNQAFRDALYKVQALSGDGWIACNSFGLRLFTTTQFDIEVPEDLSRKGRYLLISNHQTWLDIVLLQSIFNGKIPFLTFFLKKELMWVPLVGLACWSYDFPFMKRHSREYLEKHPEKREEDLITTKKFCQKFKDRPISVINFLEGTRFTKEKHKKRKSRYINLLNPKAGGIAYVMAAMDNLEHLLNITVAYPIENPSLYAFICNKMPKVTIRVKLISMPEVARGDYFHNENDREAFQNWLNDMWSEKDQQLSQLKDELRANATAVQSSRSVEASI